MLTEGETKEVTVPDVRVPIMLEITEEDRQNAGHFVNIKGCLIGTALKRMGYEPFSVGPGAVRLRDSSDNYYANLDADALCWDGQNYRPEVVGKQFILYPGE